MRGGTDLEFAPDDDPSKWLNPLCNIRQLERSLAPLSQVYLALQGNSLMAFLRFGQTKLFIDDELFAHRVESSANRNTQYNT